MLAERERRTCRRERREKAKNKGATNDAYHRGLKEAILVLRCRAHQLILDITMLQKA